MFQAVKILKEKKMKKLIVAIAALAMFASSAYAADWNFYGSARMWTFSSDVEVNNDSDRNTNWELSPYSRIGANVKVSDELIGRFEYGIVSGSESVRLRLLYGEWNFGSGSLTVGQDYERIYLAYSNQVYDGLGLGGFGDAYNGRSPQLKLKFGEFQIALIKPYSTALGTNSTSTEVTIPKVQARYTFRFDNASVRIVGGYATYEETLFDGSEEDISAYFVGVGADASFGAFRLAGNIGFGENSGMLVAVDTGSGVDGHAVVSDTAVGDTETMGFNIIAGYTVNDMFALEAGYGWIEEDFDGGGDDEAQSYYLQAPITLAPGVVVTPEVGIIDYDEDAQGETTYFGAKWQINF